MGTATATYRLALAVTIATVLFLFWAIGALGIIGEGGKEDRIYLGVFAVVLIGTVLARFRPRGMALAVLATALTHALIAFIALVAGYQDSEGASVVEILGINAMYAALFGISAWLFWRAAEQSAAAPTTSHA